LIDERGGPGLRALHTRKKREDYCWRPREEGLCWTPIEATKREESEDQRYLLGRKKTV